MLVGYLEFFRDRAVEKLRGLAPEDLWRSRVPSGWSPVALLHHLLWAERRWIEWGFLGRDVGDPWSDEIDGHWRFPAGLDLDEVGAPGPRRRGAEPATLERVLPHLVQEWARHLGHLDIVVELSGRSVRE